MQEDAIVSLIFGIITVLVACIGIYVSWWIARGKLRYVSTQRAGIDWMQDRFEDGSDNKFHNSLSTTVDSTSDANLGSHLWTSPYG